MSFKNGGGIEMFSDSQVERINHYCITHNKKYERVFFRPREMIPGGNLDLHKGMKSTRNGILLMLSLRAHL